MALDSVLPRFLAVVQQPLITQSDDAVLSCACNDLAFGLVVWHSVALVNHLLSHDRLGCLNLLSCADAYLHDTLLEALVVALVLGLLQLDSILM